MTSVLACPAVVTYCKAGATRRMPETLRVITYNLHKGVGPRRRDILGEAVDALERRRPDVLLCQEVFHGASEALHQCRFITEVLGHTFVFGPNSFYRRGCHGNATFARLPVDGHRNVDVTESRLERRGILHTTLSADGGRALEVFNVHFSLTGRQRRRQWRRLLSVLPADPATPALVCGDFNDWSNSIDRLARRSGALHSALWDVDRTGRATFPARRPVFGLDRIYFRGLALRSVEVLRGAPWTDLSDHLPIEATLEIP